MSNPDPRPIHILLVEDSDADIEMTRYAFEQGRIRNTMWVCKDGADALAYLNKKGPHADAVRPDLILLDLNLPRILGHDVLRTLRAHPDREVANIPVVVLTTSQADDDVHRAYSAHANAFISKPVDHNEFLRVVRETGKYWVTVVRLPPG